MIYVDNQNITDPRLNLALEEHLLRNVTGGESILLFYINEPSVVIGRNQNVWEEVDLDYLRENDIHLVRRLSGGGAVYHDLGNLNFSFITASTDNLHNFAKFTAPVVSVLQNYGIEAELRNRSSLFIAGKKISGNAQYMTRGRMFSHGTLLFDTNLEHLLKALNPQQEKIESRAVQSVRSVVTNLREILPPEMTINMFKEGLLHGIFGRVNIPIYELNEADWTQIEAYADERYRNWEWNVGRSPKFQVKERVKSAAGWVDIEFTVEKGRVTAVELTGDIPGRRGNRALAQKLVGVRYEQEDLAEALAKVQLQF